MDRRPSIGRARSGAPDCGAYAPSPAAAPPLPPPPPPPPPAPPASAWSDPAPAAVGGSDEASGAAPLTLRGLLRALRKLWALS